MNIIIKYCYQQAYFCFRISPYKANLGSKVGIKKDT